MNWLDVVVWICVGTGLVKGLHDGLIKQLISFISLILAIVFSGMVADILRSFLNLNIHDAIYYIFSFFLILTVFSILAKMIDKIIKATPVGTLNRLAGGVFGVLIWLLCLSFALNTLSVFDSHSLIISKEMREKSVTYEPVKKVLPIVYPYIKEFFK
jgi:membrane protein required for colicin V production